VPTTVQAGAGVVPVATQRSGAAAATVTGAKRTVDFETAPTAGTLRRRQIVLSWDRADTRFQLTRLVLAAGAAKTVRVPRKKLRNALRGKWQRVGRGLKIRGRTGRTFLVLEVRGAGRTGRRAIAAASRRRDKGRASRNGGTGTSNLNMNTYGKRNG
jgi:ribosomal protein L13E